jgi:signal transduction histidine kinase
VKPGQHNDRVEASLLLQQWLTELRARSEDEFLQPARVPDIEVVLLDFLKELTRNLRGETPAPTHQDHALLPGEAAPLMRAYARLGHAVIRLWRRAPSRRGGAEANRVADWLTAALRTTDALTQARESALRLRELTESREVHARAESERQKLQRLFMAMPMPICIFEGADLVYTFANAAFREMVGGRELVGKTLHEARPELRDTGLGNRLRAVMTTGKPDAGKEVTLRLRADPESPMRTLDFTYQALREERGQITGVLVCATDVTERVQARDASRRAAEEEKNRASLERRLIGIVSHDLKNPLSAILMSAQLLSRRATLQPENRKVVDRIRLTAERTVRLIDDLLDFTRVRLGTQLPVSRQPMNLHHVVGQVLAELRLNHPERALVLETEGDGEGLWDPGRMSQLAMNLVANALKYGLPGSPVEVGIRGDAGRVELRVHNDGKPISESVAGVIFEPMQRGNAQTDVTGRSLGLGLYIVRHIVEAHGGAVSFTSSAEAGTTFTVALPRSPAAVASSA